MPSLFDQQFKRSAFPQLIEQFGEPVVYFLRGGGQRTIMAIVVRDPPATYDAAGNVVLPSFNIRVMNDCLTGILSSEVDTGGDEVELIGKVGSSIPVRKTVMKMESQSASVVVLVLK